MELRFTDFTKDLKVIKAINIATSLFVKDSAMILEISNKNDWKYNSGEGIKISEDLIKDLPPINVRTYRPWNLWTKALGYFDGKQIFINSGKLNNMSVEDIAANLSHEYCHYVGFSHGGNYKTEDKCKYSVPYYVSENIRKWI